MFKANRSIKGIILYIKQGEAKVVKVVMPQDWAQDSDDTGFYQVSPCMSPQKQSCRVHAL